MEDSILKDRRVVVIISGGIAAYKAADLVSRLVKTGAQVRVAMTASATKFVAPLTFESLCGHPVYLDVFERAGAWEMEHISWSQWAELVIAAPATANLIAKMSAGLADDAATTLLLAYKGPLWIAPAMNTAMLGHPATRANLATLAARGVRIIEAESGPLACGQVGAGRLAEPPSIVQTLEREFAALQARPLKGRRVLITSGPTREALDPIRFISNRSTGQMGSALAECALALGAQVVFIHGVQSAPVPAGAQDVPVQGARDMLAAVQAHWEGADVAIFAAAVANYESTQQDANKIKGGQTLTLTLTRTPDIAAWGGANRRAGQYLVGFAAESQDLMAAAAHKLETKKLDLICANPIGQAGVGFEAGENQVTLLDAQGRQTPSPQMSKPQIATWIWEQIIERTQES